MSDRITRQSEKREMTDAARKGKNAASAGDGAGDGSGVCQDLVVVAMVEAERVGAERQRERAERENAASASHDAGNDAGDDAGDAARLAGLVGLELVPGTNPSEGIFKAHFTFINGFFIPDSLVALYNRLVRVHNSFRPTILDGIGISGLSNGVLVGGLQVVDEIDKCSKSDLTLDMIIRWEKLVQHMQGSGFEISWLREGLQELRSSDSFNERGPLTPLDVAETELLASKLVDADIDKKFEDIQNSQKNLEDLLIQIRNEVTAIEHGRNENRKKTAAIQARYDVLLAVRKKRQIDAQYSVYY